ncbi:MAG: DUF3047 domain-containing protein [Mariprofundaceae bacterium]|nr:DUF3047 domain-containing protein [Mariprofundaceae bacterium]
MFKTMITFLLLFTPIFANANNLPIGQFSKNDLSNWKEKVFDGKTIYTFVLDKQNQQHVLQASSSSTASGLFYKMRIDLEKTPYLNWSWKTSSAFDVIDETKKSGDDFVARIYIVVDGGLFFWRTLAISYVWSSSHKIGEKWKNPYTSNTTMFAVESGREKLGLWQHYKRNVREDLKKFMNKDTRYIDAVAIMTDSDNSGKSATTSFGDIFFTAE